MKYEPAKIEIIHFKNDILTLSIKLLNNDEGWNDLEFGKSKDSSVGQIVPTR